MGSILKARSAANEELRSGERLCSSRTTKSSRENTELSSPLKDELTKAHADLEQRNAEIAQLRKQLEEARGLMDLQSVASSGRIMLDMDLAIVEADQAAAELLSGDLGGIIGLRLPFIVALESQNELYLHLNRLIQEGGKQVSVLRLRTANRYGELIQLQSMPVEGTASRFQSVICSVTESKQILDALRESERKLSTLMSNMPGLAFRCANNRDYTMEFVSEGCKELTGYLPSDVCRNTNVSWGALILPEDQDRVWNEIQEGLNAKGQYQTDYRIRTASGKIKWVWEQGRAVSPEGEPLVIEGFITDITKRVHTEEALRESERKLSTLMSNMPGLAFRCANDHDYTMAFVSEGCKELTGYLPSELNNSISITWGAMILPEDADRVWNEIQAGLQSGGYYQTNYRIRTSAGKIKWVWEQGRAVSPEGEPLVIEGFITDISDRIHVEEALRESERKLSTLMGNMPGLAFRCANNRDYTMEFVSEGCKELTGYLSSEVKHNSRISWGALIHPEDQDRVWNEIQEGLNAGRPYQTNYRIVTASGEIKWVWEQGRAVLSSQEELLAVEGFITDITKRVHTEEALRESERKLSTLMSNMPGLAFRCANNRDYTMEFVSEGCKELTGYLPSDVCQNTNISWGALILPEDQDRVWNEIQAGLSSPKGQYQTNYRIRTASGGIKWVWEQGRAVLSSQGELLAVEGFITDTTEQVNNHNRIEELARQAEQERMRLQAILDTLPIGVLIADSDGQVIERNEVADNVWGGHVPLPRNIKEYNVYKGWWSNTGIPVKAKDWGLARAVSKGETSLGETIDIQRFDGTRGTVLCSSAPIRNEHGIIIGGLMVCQDITHQRELEHEAIEAKERADMYIDLLTHDISNLNTAAIGHLQLAQEKLQLDGKDRKLITEPLGALIDSSNLIENIRRVQQVESSETRNSPIDIGEALEEVVKFYNSIDGKDIVIKYEPKANRMTYANEMLRNVFSNIVDNAINHSNRPVTIGIVLTKAFESGREHHKVIIEDDGPGIPDDMKTKVFVRMQRGKATAWGKGLGLYLVKILIEEYGGNIWVEDRVPGDHTKGARFVILLPVLAREEGRAVVSAEPEVE